AGDFDGDGRAEIAILPETTTAGQGTTLKFADFRPGTLAADPATNGTWAALPDLDLRAEQVPALAVVSGDFDGDGTDELARLGNSRVWLRKYDVRAGAWLPFTTTGLLAAGDPVSFGFASAGRFGSATGPVALALHPGQFATSGGAPLPAAGGHGGDGPVSLQK